MDVVERTFMRTHTRRGNGDVHTGIRRLNPVRVQPGVKGVAPPLIEAEQRAHVHRTHTRAGRPIRSVQTEPEIALGTGGMQLEVQLLVIRLLKHRERIHSRVHQHPVVILAHGIDLDADAREIRAQATGPLRDVRGPGQLRSVTGQKQDVAEPGRGDDLAFGLHLVHRQHGAMDMVLGVEAAVHALVGTVVGEIKRRKQLDGAPELPDRHVAGNTGHRFKMRRGGGRYQRHEIPGVQASAVFRQLQRGQHIRFRG